MNFQWRLGVSALHSQGRRVQARKIPRKALGNRKFENRKIRKPKIRKPKNRKNRKLGRFASDEFEYKAYHHWWLTWFQLYHSSSSHQQTLFLMVLFFFLSNYMLYCTRTNICILGNHTLLVVKKCTAIKLNHLKQLCQKY